MSKIKTATVTWISWNNFGTYLQAYALQQVIESMGYANAILSDKRIVREHEPKNIRYILGGLKAKFINLFSSNRISNSLFKRFSKEWMKIDEWSELDKLTAEYDIFICGSDQIWSPNVSYDSYYYLGFTDKKKIAYAPSIGTVSYPDQLISKVKPLLQKFEYLSVREEQGSEIIRNKFGLNCSTVLDPTLLLTTQDWEKLIGNRDNEDYVLCYLLTYNEHYLNFVREFADSKQLKLKIFIIDKRMSQFADCKLYAGPKEFLEEIYNSKYFFTDSFHGSIFAIQFRKNFYTFERFKKEASNNQNSRIENLFGKLQLMDRFISEKNLPRINFKENIDYDKVHQLLNDDRINSISYLSNALKD